MHPIQRSHRKQGLASFLRFWTQNEAIKRILRIYNFIITATRFEPLGQSTIKEGLKQKGKDILVGETIKKRVDEERTTKEGIEKENTKPRQP